MQTFEKYLREHSEQAAANYAKGHFFKPYLRLYPSLTPQNQVMFYAETGLRNISKIVRSPDFVISANDEVIAIDEIADEIADIIAAAIAQAIRDGKGQPYEGSRLESLALLTKAAIETCDYTQVVDLARLTLREAADRE